MATLYWKGKTNGGAASTDWQSTSSWRTTNVAGNGGSYPAAIPTSADDVVFNANSNDNCNLNANSYCNNINFTGFTRTFTHTAGCNLDVYGSWTSVSGMTLTVSNPVTSTLTFKATSTGKTITSGGKTLPSATFNGAGGGWTLGDATTFTTSWTLSVAQGSFNTAGYALTCGFLFSTDTTYTRSITLSNSTVTCVMTSFLGNGGWSIMPTNLTLSAASSTINLTGSYTTDVSCKMAGGAYGVVYFSDVQAEITIDGGNLTAVNFAALGKSLYGAIILTGNITGQSYHGFRGNSVSERLMVRSDTPGTQRTYSFAGWGLFGGNGPSYLDLQDIYYDDPTSADPGFYGWGTSIGDGGGNTTNYMSFDAPRNVTATTPGNWGATATWGGSNPPLVQDTAILGAGAAAGTYVMNGRHWGNIDCTGFTRTLQVLGVSNRMYGSFILVSGMTFVCSSAASFTLIPQSSTARSITSGTKTYTTNPFTVEALRGSVTFTDNFTSTSTMTLNRGTMILGSGITMSVTSFSSNNSNTRALTLTGSAVFAVSGTGTVWNTATTTGMTFTCNTSIIDLTDGTATGKSALFGGLTYYTIRFSGAGSPAYYVQGFRCTNLTNNKSVAFTITFEYFFQNYYVENWNCSGTSGNVVTLQSSSTGNQWTFQFTGSNPQVGNYLAIKDMYCGWNGFSAPFTNSFHVYNGTDNGNNLYVKFMPRDVYKNALLLLGAGT